MENNLFYGDFISSDKTKISFSLFVPRFMDTSMLNVDVQPTYIRVEVKDKIT